MKNNTELNHLQEQVSSQANEIAQQRAAKTINLTNQAAQTGRELAAAPCSLSRIESELGISPDQISFKTSSIRHLNHLIGSGEWKITAKLFRGNWNKKEVEVDFELIRANKKWFAPQMWDQMGFSDDNSD